MHYFPYNPFYHFVGSYLKLYSNLLLIIELGFLSNVVGLFQFFKNYWFQLFIYSTFIHILILWEKKLRFKEHAILNISETLKNMWFYGWLYLLFLFSKESTFLGQTFFFSIFWDPCIYTKTNNLMFWKYQL
jgi:hypothetical protein